MQSREIVKNAIKGKKVERLPIGELVLDNDVIKDILKKDQINFEDRLKFAADLGLDLITLSPKYSNEQDIVNLNYENLDIKKWVESGLFTFVILDGAFEYGMRMFGFQEFFTMVVSGDDSTQNFIKEVENLNRKIIKELASLGIDGIIIADDVAYQSGLMIRPQIFKDIFLPSLEKQVKEIKENGMIPFFHSDGDYLSIMDDIVNTGFEGVHCIDQKCNVRLKSFETFRNKITLWGHLDVDYIEDSAEEAKMEEIRNEIEEATGYNRFILGTNSGLFPGMDVGQLKKIFEAVS